MFCGTTKIQGTLSTPFSKGGNFLYTVQWPFTAVPAATARVMTLEVAWRGSVKKKPLKNRIFGTIQFFRFVSIFENVRYLFIFV